MNVIGTMLEALASYKKECKPTGSSIDAGTFAAWVMQDEHDPLAHSVGIHLVMKTLSDLCTASDRVIPLADESGIRTERERIWINGSVRTLITGPLNPKGTDTTEVHADDTYSGPLHLPTLTVPHDTQSEAPSIKREDITRVQNVLVRIQIPNDWEINFDFKGDQMYIQIEDKVGLCNVTGDAFPWRGRKYNISKYMTDGEIVQTAFVALMSAVEHETREGFKYRGQSIFDPHYDVEKLVELRQSKGCLSYREERHEELMS